MSLKLKKNSRGEVAASSGLGITLGKTLIYFSSIYTVKIIYFRYSGN